MVRECIVELLRAAVGKSEYVVRDVVSPSVLLLFPQRTLLPPHLIRSQHLLKLLMQLGREGQGGAHFYHFSHTLRRGREEGAL